MTDKNIEPEKVKNIKLLNPSLDFIFKLIFGNPLNVDVTRRFLSSVLNLFGEELVRLTFTNNELLREHKDGKKGVLDVRVTTDKGTDIIVEVQVCPDRAMADRSLYYWSRMFTSHLEKSQDFGKLTKTIAINILHFNLFDYPRYHSTFHIREDNEGTILTDLFRIDFLELAKVKNLKEISKDEKTQWLQFLTTRDEEVLNMLGQENPTIGKAVGILKELSGDEKVRMEAFYREKEIRDEISRQTSARLEEREAIAIKLLSMGFDVKVIQDATSLTEAQIMALKTRTP